eukprot:11284395-Alexandrium_andersonii.AAC.1
MLEERGYMANCLKRPRVRNSRLAAGTRCSEERQARFETILRASNDPSMIRADQRVNDYLADQARAGAERAQAPAASSSSGGVRTSGHAAAVPD